VRTPAEIAFRLRQELAGLYLWRYPPALTAEPGRPTLPDAVPVAARLRSTPFAAGVVRLANEILRHRFPIFGGFLDAGDQIHWRRDYVHQIETGTPYFRRVPYLDFGRAGDHKYIWELNRHQHLVVLAQAFGFTGDREYLVEAERQLVSWLAANPFLRGINWTSALEAALRALSLVWLDHLAGAALTREFRHTLLTALYRHGCFLEHNLSVYFSPNTHLLGEAVALHALGALYPDFPHSRRWRARGHRLVEEQMEKQVRADGTHFEQSTYYHVYALDFFLWHDLLAETSAGYRDKLGRMAAYLDALLGPAGRIPLIGDDDGGRVFHPFGDRDAFGRASLATCGVRFGKPEWIRSKDDLPEQAAWWIGERALDAEPAPGEAAASRLFPDAGIAVMAAGAVQIVVKAGGFGSSSAGHSHSDALSFVCRCGEQEILIDPGAYTYRADAEWRNGFRGSAAHNTVRIGGRDQAAPAGPFRWEGRPTVRIRKWASTAERDWLDAECRYGGFVHRRRFLFLKPDLLFILDRVDGPPGEHLIEQFWHGSGDPDAFHRLVLSRPSEPVEAWRSRQFGSKELSPAECMVYRGPLPILLAAAVSFGEIPEAVMLEGNLEHPALTLRFRDGRVKNIAVPE
jgi:hypothetical protein